MNRKQLRFIIVFLAGISICLIAFAGSIRAQRPAVRDIANPFTSEKTDERLQVKVSIPSGRYRIGELLELLTTMTGVTLTATDRDEVAGEVLFVCLENEKLTDVMKALASTLSYRSASVRWESATKDAPVYFLKRRRRNGEISSRLREKLQEECISLEKDMLDHCKSDEDLEAAMNAHGVFPRPGSVPIYRNWMRFLNDCIPEKDRDALLDGEKVIRIPMASSKIVNDHGSTMGGMISQIPDVLMIRNRIDRSSGVIDLEVGGSITALDGMSGTTFFRGLNLCNSLGQRRGADFASDWCLAEDTKSNARLESELFPAKVAEGPGMDEPKLAFDIKKYPEIPYLNGLQRGKKISYIARLPYRDAVGERVLECNPYGKPIGQFLKDDLCNTIMYYKWNSRILLVSYPAWLVPDPVVPWEFAKEVKRSVAEYDRPTPTKAWTYVRVYELAALGRNLGLSQWVTLANESPVIRNVGNMYPLLARAKESETFRKELFSGRGIPIDQVLALSNDPKWPEQFDNPAGTRPVAFVRVWHKDSSINFAYLDKDQQWIQGTGFSLWTNRPAPGTPPSKASTNP